MIRLTRFTEQAAMSPDFCDDELRSLATDRRRGLDQRNRELWQEARDEIQTKYSANEWVPRLNRAGQSIGKGAGRSTKNVGQGIGQGLYNEYIRFVTEILNDVEAKLDQFADEIDEIIRRCRPNAQDSDPCEHCRRRINERHRFWLDELNRLYRRVVTTVPSPGVLFADILEQPPGETGDNLLEEWLSAVEPVVKASLVGRGVNWVRNALITASGVVTAPAEAIGITPRVTRIVTSIGIEAPILMVLESMRAQNRLGGQLRQEHFERLIDEIVDRAIEEMEARGLIEQMRRTVIGEIACPENEQFVEGLIERVQSGVAAACDDPVIPSVVARGNQVLRGPAGEACPNIGRLLNELEAAFEEECQ